ncbi:hypothetical protein [Metallibacterium sp.]|uniref:hypothetical protein n=1 Tax=Metallibacterium sp. TaxID=2940281 RepID=UPI002636E3B6|nr:hypothetical protein [Metallibacterium sp.]
MGRTPSPDTDFLAYAAHLLKTYRGDATEFERAVGAYVLGLSMGWKPLLLIHDRKVVRKYGEILELDFKERLPEVGVMARRAVAWRLVLKVSSFWKAAKGEIAGVRSNLIE